MGGLVLVGFFFLVGGFVLGFMGLFLVWFRVWFFCCCWFLVFFVFFFFKFVISLLSSSGPSYVLATSVFLMRNVTCVLLNACSETRTATKL